VKDVVPHGRNGREREVGAAPLGGPPLRGKQQRVLSLPFDARSGRGWSTPRGGPGANHVPKCVPKCAFLEVPERTERTSSVPRERIPALAREILSPETRVRIPVAVPPNSRARKRDLKSWGTARPSHCPSRSFGTANGRGGVSDAAPPGVDRPPRRRTEFVAAAPRGSRSYEIACRSQRSAGRVIAMVHERRPSKLGTAVLGLLALVLFSPLPLLRGGRWLPPMRTSATGRFFATSHDVTVQTPDKRTADLLKAILRREADWANVTIVTGIDGTGR
jgi:hypothetical protein